MTEEQRQAISKLAVPLDDVLADVMLYVGAKMLPPLCLGVAIVGVLALYGSFPWIERVYDRWRHRRIVEAQKNRWN